VFDPRVLYDPDSQRWIAVAVTDRGTSVSSLLIAVSATSDPTGTWYLNQLDADSSNTKWLDFPAVGFNKDKIVVTGTYIDATGFNAGSLLVVFDKASLYAGNILIQGFNYGTLNLAEASFGYGLAPAATYDTNQSAVYLVRSVNGNLSNNGYLAIYTVGGSVTSPTVTTNAFPMTTAVWTNNPVASQINFGRQLGSTQRVHTGDDRIHSVVYRNGFLWCAHTIYLPASNPTRNAIQWWQLNPTNGSTIQRGRIEDTTGVKAYGYPSIAVNKFRDVLIGYSTFSTNQYPSASYSFHACNDLTSTMQSESLLKAGEGPFYRTDSGGRNRWGDYSATVIDPSNDIDMWTIQEYSRPAVGTGTNSGRWGTWWGKVTLPLPANDHFTNYFTVSSDEGSTNGTNVRATRETGEPNHGGNTNTPSVWYRWVAPANGNVTFDTTNRGSSFSMVLAIYTGSAVNALTLKTNATGTAPRATFNAVSNTTYQIAVAGLNGACGDFTLNWVKPSPPMFIKHPQTTNVVVGETVTLSSLAIGTPDPWYQWRQEGTNIVGATNADLTINNVQLWHGTNYTVVATNISGSKTSSVASLIIHGDSAARLSLFEFPSASQFRMHISGLTNRSYLIQTSTNLNSSTNWYPIYTNFVSFWYTNTTATEAKRFYRVITN